MSGRILLIDSCPIIHVGVAATIRNTDLQLGMAPDSLREASEWLESGTADLWLSEFEFADGKADDAQKIANRLKVPLVLFSTSQNPVFVGRMVDAGSAGLIPKTTSVEDLIARLRNVLEVKKLWERRDTRRVTGALATPRLTSHIDFPLTQREFQVLKEMASGQPTKMVAESLGISYETVKEHVQHVLVKLGVNDRTQAAILAVRRGLL